MPEGRDVLSGRFDVIVCDGFVGNVLLKFAEAVGEDATNRGGVTLLHGSWVTSLLKPNLKRIKQRIDHAEHGGGLIRCGWYLHYQHGSSQAPSILMQFAG